MDVGSLNSSWLLNEIYSKYRGHKYLRKCTNRNWLCTASFHSELEYSISLHFHAVKCKLNEQKKRLGNVKIGFSRTEALPNILKRFLSISTPLSNYANYAMSKKYAKLYSFISAFERRLVVHPFRTSYVDWQLLTHCF